MLLHNFLYACKGIFRERTSLFWTAVFPFLLGTLFVVSFGHAVERAEQYHEIPVGIVKEPVSEAKSGKMSGEQEDRSGSYDRTEAFLKVIESIEDENGTGMFSVTVLSEKEAVKALDNETLDGYYRVGDDISLVIAKNGTNQTILNVFLEEYRKRSAMAEDVLKTHPDRLPAMLAAMEDEISYYQEVNQTEGNMDSMAQYFYALIAMSCLFGSNLSLERAKRLQADVSALGARRGVAPVKKSTVILAEFFSCLLVQCVVGAVLIAYLKGVCGMHLGDKTGYMLLTVFTGSAFGVALGFCIGSVSGLSEGAKGGMNLSITLGLSFFSGLMIHTVKQFLEDHVPLVNRINPATLIADALYALNVYDTMERYWTNMLTLFLLTAALCTATILMVRRTRYASI